MSSSNQRLYRQWERVRKLKYGERVSWRSLGAVCRDALAMSIFALATYIATDEGRTWIAEAGKAAVEEADEELRRMGR